MPAAQLTIPTTVPQAEGVEKPDTAGSSCGCEGHTDTAEGTDETTATGDKAQPAEGQGTGQQSKKVTEEGAHHPGDGTAQNPQSETLEEVYERLSKEGGEGEIKEAAKGAAE